MTFSPDGTPLGLLNVQCWARDPAAAGQRHRRHDLAIEQQESAQWRVSCRTAAAVQQLCPAATLVSIGDREADSYELLAAALRQPARPGLLVRLERTATAKRPVNRGGTSWRPGLWLARSS